LNRTTSSLKNFQLIKFTQMKNITTLLIIIMLATTVYGQQTNAENIAALPGADTGRLAPHQNAATGQRYENGMKSEANSIVARPVSVQVLVGSQGVGADIKYGILPKLSGRMGFGIIPVTVSGVFGFSSFASYNQMSAHFSNVHLLADYSPFNSGRFRLVGGAAYLIKGNANVLITPAGTYQFGNTTVNSNQVGVLQASVDWKGVAPYLGVSLFRAFPNKFFNTNIDIGTYYLSSPGTSLTGTKMLADNSSQEPQLNKNMQGYRWLPVVQLNFNFRIK
jgi:hypothetical protein